MQKYFAKECLVILTTILNTQFADLLEILLFLILNLKTQNLFAAVDADHLPVSLGQRIRLWLFLDVFEHIASPSPYMRWIQNNSAPRAQILMVLPRADSFSQCLMGRLWPHAVPDHTFHWSRNGIRDFMENHGFILQAEFNPIKDVSVQMIITHIMNASGIGNRHFPGSEGLGKLSFPLNFGEMGLLFELKP